MEKNQKRKIEEQEMKENIETISSALTAFSGAVAWSSTAFSIAWIIVTCIETFAK
jgi:hypothetical protein